MLELIAKRGRALVGALSLAIALVDGDDLVLAAVAGRGSARPGEVRIPLKGTVFAHIVRRGASRRITGAGPLRNAASLLGIEGTRAALGVPLVYRSQRLGVMLAFDRGPRAEPFREADEKALKAFAASAATAVATARSVQRQRLRDAMAAAEAERRRWAQELHDETLQALGGLRIVLVLRAPLGQARHADGRHGPGDRCD